MTTGAEPHIDGEEAAQEILARLEEKPTLSRYVAAARDLEALGERYPDLFRPLDVFVLRNFTIEPIEPLLAVAGFRARLRINLAYSGYDPAPDELEKSGERSDVVIVALTLEDIAPALGREFLATSPDERGALAEAAQDRVISLVQTVRRHTRAPVLVHNFITPVAPAAGLSDTQDAAGQLNLIRQMNVELVHEIGRIDGVHVVDVEHIFCSLGLKTALDDRGGRLSGAPLSQAALKQLAGSYVRYLKALEGPQIKCVVLDCDGTLWGGVVGEDGIQGIELGESGPGRKYRDFQRELLNLKQRGTVLAISSKNEETDVLDVLANHPDCLLRQTDFAAMRVDWEDKAHNVASIADQLRLSLEHVLFIDDNPVELEWVQARLPQIRVLAAPSSPGGFDRSLDDLELFDSIVLTQEDRARTDMYRADSQRRTVRATVDSVEDFLRSLEMIVTVGPARRQDLARLAQLTMKTNQFNLTSRRHDVQALEHFMEDPQAGVLWLELRDRFGSSGVVGCGVVRRLDDEAAVIDTLLLSCRVIGRQLENVMVNRLARLARGMGAGVLVGEFIPTARNAQVADLYTRLGFAGPEPGPEPDLERWQLSLNSGDPPVPELFEVVDLEPAR